MITQRLDGRVWRLPEAPVGLEAEVRHAIGRPNRPTLQSEVFYRQLLRVLKLDGRPNVEVPPWEFVKVVRIEADRRGVDVLLEFHDGREFTCRINFPERIGGLL